MRPVILLALAAWPVALGGCNKADGSPVAGNAFSPRGHFVGVGIYTPGPMWTQLTRAAASTHPAAANPEDDEQVIVVLDSKTGELRQCGNLSGHCITMNPWSSRLPLAQQSPVTVLKHARQLAEEAEAEAARPARRTSSPPR